MTSNELLNKYYNPHTNQFNDLFIQMFVETNNAINYRFLNSFHETKFSHNEINTAIQDISGSNVVKYREVDFASDCFGFELFKKAYKFGKFENVRQWIHDFWFQTDIVPSRKLILNWIATQRPDKQQSSFLPSSTGNLYNDIKEKPISRANESDSEAA